MHGTNTGGNAWLDTKRQLIKHEPAQQEALYVLPMQTKYIFSCGSVNLEVDFLSPLLVMILIFITSCFIHRFAVTAKDSIIMKRISYSREFKCGNKGNEFMKATNYQAKI
jgi:hypothetical protein